MLDLYVLRCLCLCPIEFNVCKGHFPELKCLLCVSLFITCVGQHLAKLLIEKLCLIHTLCAQSIKQSQTLLLLVYSLYLYELFMNLLYLIMFIMNYYPQMKSQAITANKQNKLDRGRLFGM